MTNLCSVQVSSGRYGNVNCLRSITGTLSSYINDTWNAFIIKVNSPTSTTVASAFSGIFSRSLNSCFDLDLCKPSTRGISFCRDKEVDIYTETNTHTETYCTRDCTEPGTSFLSMSGQGWESESVLPAMSGSAAVGSGGATWLLLW